MDDQEFLEFRNALDKLHFLGMITAIFPLKEEIIIQNAIKERYNDVSKDNLQLCGVKLIFI